MCGRGARQAKKFWPDDGDHNDLCVKKLIDILISSVLIYNIKNIIFFFHIKKNLYLCIR